MQLFNYLHVHFPNNLLIPNIYIEWDKGKTSEIDLCMLTNKFLFVFEYKNYSVSVFGDETDKQWTYYKNGQAYHFCSPILQNQGHVRSLKKLCSYFPEGRIIPIVVFSNRVKLHVHAESPVLHRKQVANYVENLHSYCDSDLVFSIIERIAIDLSTRSKQSDLIKAQHIAYIKSRHFD